MNDASARSWKLERDADGIAWLTLDKPGTSTNVLSAGVLTELDELLDALEHDRPRGAVLLSAK
jgi:3-hydroxyacyl-CoA dehydrogenase/enoyl-CoA hydratase/3-hydroxybutyryl-CoA epimerase